VNNIEAQVLIHARRYEEAIDVCIRSLEKNPDFYYPHWYLGRARYYLGDYENSADSQIRLMIARGATEEEIKALRRAFEKEGISGFARARLISRLRRDAYLVGPGAYDEITVVHQAGGALVQRQSRRETVPLRQEGPGRVLYVQRGLEVHLGDHGGHALGSDQFGGGNGGSLQHQPVLEQFDGPFLEGQRLVAPVDKIYRLDDEIIVRGCAFVSQTHNPCLVGDQGVAGSNTDLDTVRRGRRLTRED
jgi:tetratricopeptide (TPR) repeat protein